MTAPKLRSELDSRLEDVEVFIAAGGTTRELRGYHLEAGRLRKAIAKRDAVLKRIHAGQRQFYGSERAIALAEAEDMAYAHGLPKHEQSMWAGVAFAILAS